MHLFWKNDRYLASPRRTDDENRSPTHFVIDHSWALGNVLSFLYIFTEGDDARTLKCYGVDRSKACQLHHQFERSSVFPATIGTYTKDSCPAFVAAQLKTCFPQFLVIELEPPGCWSTNCPMSNTPLPACRQTR